MAAPGLTGLKGGGVVSLPNSVASLGGLHRHAYGVRAVDNAGGEWMYAKASTSAIVGSLVFLAPGADPFQATVPSTGGIGISTVQGTSLGIQNCTANSTTQDCWIQMSGTLNALIDTTAAAAGISLFISTTVAGALSVTTTGARLFGVSIQSTAGAGLAVGTGVPALVSAPNGLIINIA